MKLLHLSSLLLAACALLAAPLSLANAAPLAWYAGPTLPTPRSQAAAWAFSGGAIYVAGGYSGDGDISILDAYPGATSWVVSPAVLDTGRLKPGLASADGSTLDVFGGYEIGGDVLNTAQNLTLSADIATDLAQMSFGSYGPAVATDAAGKIYAIGGVALGNTALASAEVYDSNAGTWSAIRPLPAPLCDSGAASDGNGHIFVFGGSATASGTAGSTAAYEYTIATNTWATAAPVPVATQNGVVLAGPSGKIYVLGGLGQGAALAAAQVYDIATNTWSAGTALPYAVYDAAGAVDDAGRLFVIGGTGSTGTRLATVTQSQPLAQPDDAPSFPYLPTQTLTALSPSTFTVTATGNPPPIVSLVSGPSGLTVASTGVVTFTPTLAEVGQTIPVVLKATNALGSVTGTVNIAVVAPAPTIPQGFTVVSVTETTATVSWTASADPYQPLTYGVYQYYGHSGRGGGYGYYSLVTGISGTTATVTGLMPGHSYALCVAAFAGTVKSGYSNFWYATPPTPTSPTNLKVTATTATTVGLSWSPATSAGTPLTYRIYQDAYLNGGVYTLKASNISGLTGSITGLTPATTYYFFVDAVDGTGYVTGNTNEVQVTTAALAPTITGFTPASGPAGTAVTITGTNLTGTTIVGFQGRHAASFTVNGAGTQITTTVPAGAVTGPVAVLTPGGQAKSAAKFTVTP